MALEGRVRSVAHGGRSRGTGAARGAARGRAVRTGAPVAAGLLLLLVALLVGAVGRWLPLVAVASLGLAVAELLLLRLLTAALPRQIGAVLGALDARIALEQALLLVFVVQLDQLSAATRAAVVVAVAVYQLLRMAHAAQGHAVERLAVPRAQVRGIAGAPVLRTRLSPLLADQGQELLVAASALPGIALVWALATGSHVLLAPAAVLMALAAAAVVARGGVDVLALVRRPRGARLFTAVHEAVVRHRPDVVLYAADGGPRDAHWVTPWLDVLDDLDRPALVVVRDPGLFDALPPARTPVVCLPGHRDVRALALPDTRVALYVSNSADNVRLLRDPGLRSAFIGHGDSDKSSSTNPVMKAYDEVWVAGEGARARLLRADVGVRADAVRVVGRPQVRRVQRRTAARTGAPVTVLYAPTWEGGSGDPAECSLLHSGLAVVERLLALGDVRVLYRPHPNTGSRDPRVARESQRIRAALARAGAPHAVVEAPATDVYTALNAADVLVTDITSVITDFLASGKPYLVVNGSDLDDAAFRDRYPSSAGAQLVGRGGEGLEAALADARGADSMRPAREALRVHLIGPPAEDPVGVFSAAIDALGSTLARRPQAAPRADPRAAVVPPPGRAA
ncbi:CDP-glycerol glycerophosphotransferase family protein [Quadrisphaera sp. DSM 44207]|uniref:CDP-glycerol glycerophosphotransferase family protein n=1 Tax=Quadrisphaera sp. DSM 44207 TaxID=1881057 RepID=UPI0008804387|nr:CDP-glycerol glycerophosphotransferase family protein [Quadrisphaera sp. DSM 44207]SDQ68046.1 CDP-Glycerol:Poly(glycerophosphate) glycerophosphotransferase [Quadrisphaera sp. DSM 44207]